MHAILQILQGWKDFADDCSAMMHVLDFVLGHGADAGLFFTKFIKRRQYHSPHTDCQMPSCGKCGRGVCNRAAGSGAASCRATTRACKQRLGSEHLDRAHDPARVIVLMFVLMIAASALQRASKSRVRGETPDFVSQGAAQCQML